MDAAMQLDGVSKRYRGGVEALSDVSFEIAAGARSCLLGPNGAGKSTAIRLLEGALRPTRGVVRLLGSTADSAGYGDARRRTGIVPQRPGMYADLTVREYLTLARDAYRRGDIAAVADVFGLAGEMEKTLATLSGGYQRRVVLAAALLAGPDVLLLDEPTVGLDPVAARDVREFLRTAMQGRTTLLCTHDLREAEALCEEAVILREGRVLVHEPISALRGRAQPRVRLRARQGPEAIAAVLSGRGISSEMDGDSAIARADAERDAPDLLRALLVAGIDVYECEPVVATLEEIFLGIVGAA